MKDYSEMDEIELAREARRRYGDDFLKCRKPNKNDVFTTRSVKI